MGQGDVQEQRKSEKSSEREREGEF